MLCKPRLFPKIIQFSNKICSYENYNFSLQKKNIHTPLVYIFTLGKFQKLPNYIFPTQNAINYCTNAIEIPPPPKESDVFGTLGGLKYESVELDESELKEEERVKNIRANVPRKFKPTAGQYAEMIKKYVERGNLKGAEDVMKLCKKNNDKPTRYMFTLLINAFAIHGDVKNCYKYFSEMKTRQIKVNQNVFTSLFNACANSSDSVKAISYLNKSKEYMEKIDCSMNHAHYNAIVKALGRHHRYDEAQRLFQTMMDNNMKIGISTLNSLMYAANSNKESGLKDILQIWQLMRKLKIPPDVFTYHLLLRGIRETNFGGCTMSELLLNDKDCKAVTDHNRPNLLVYPPIVSDLPMTNIHKKSGVKLIESSAESTVPNSTPSSISVSDESKNTNIKILPDSIASLDLDAVLQKNKLILFGGVEGFLQKMKDDRIEPTVKTMTYLMELVPPSTAAENKIIEYASLKNVQLDIDFFNMLIKKRALRKCKKDAKDVINDIVKADLKPNIVTYGVLAMACDGSNDSRELLRTMKSTDIPLNKYIADNLLSSAFLRRDFIFILELMERMYYQKIRLDEETFEKMDKFKQDMTELVMRKDKRAKTDFFQASFSKFKMRYKEWQKQMNRNIITERESKEK